MNGNIKNTRLLAAVMFTDIVGYTALMQKNEKQAMYMRICKRRALEMNIVKHQGKVVQYFGDGSLSIFKSSLNAVTSAINIQNILQKKLVPVRIGIHLGEIVYNNDGIYGNAVNIASRIESLSLPGSVLISNSVYLEVKNQTEIKTAALGTFEFKNVEHPIKIYTLKNQESEIMFKQINNKWDKIQSKRVVTDLVKTVLSNIDTGINN
jgi:class 3 adenylate cyclase